ncbi:MAG: hypothetical protein U0871_27550 [Gemmataceae bacterium]
MTPFQAKTVAHPQQARNGASMVISTAPADSVGTVIATATVASPTRGVKAVAASRYTAANRRALHTTAGSRTASMVGPSSSQLPRINQATSGPLL